MHDKVHQNADEQHPAQAVGLGVGGRKSRRQCDTGIQQHVDEIASCEQRRKDERDCRDKTEHEDDQHARVECAIRNEMRLHVPLPLG